MPDEQTARTPDQSGLDTFTPLIGQTAKGCWLGYGSVLFLEFGDRIGPETLQYHRSGEWSLWCDQILWRIEQQDRVLAGSEDDRSTMEAAIDQINGHVLMSGETCGSTGDSILRFNDDLVLRTFVLTSEEDARWHFKHGDAAYILLGPSFTTSPTADSLADNNPGGDTRFVFDNDRTLTCFPANSRQGVSWVIATNDGNELKLGPGSRIAYETGLR